MGSGYFVIANAIASVYNLLVLSLGFLLCKCKRYEVTIHLADMVMMALVATLE
ncbi:hypothetical protein [Klebsiella aerogenes]|uniref:hypothetical protein n=1 Tax=Klebsiella aerogenes TaxID=548 RepID=UPI0013D03DA5|nr:hypothetical protein [Klebsiella aerogenes]